MEKRNFEIFPAKRESVPVWLSLIGASGSGKTYSALRLATGMAEVLESKVFVIDTEGRRALHYADKFKFQHLPLGEPFGSLDYLGAVRTCVGKGARVVVIDSMSHEHEGSGGYLASQEAELLRLAGDDWDKRQRVQLLSWSVPSARRNAMLQGLLQLSVSLVCCFRAKERFKPLKGSDGKLVPTEMGWSAIGGESLTYEMTASCLLYPRAGGVPTWESDYLGERAAMKLPEQFMTILPKGRALDEETGKRLAAWAAGRGGEESVGGAPRDNAAGRSNSANAGRHYPANLAVEYREGFDLLAGAAKHGTKILKAGWERLSREQQKALKEHLDELKRQAREFDRRHEAP